MKGKKMLHQLKSEYITARNCARKWAKDYQQTHNPHSRICARFAVEIMRSTAKIYKDITGLTI